MSDDGFWIGGGGHAPRWARTCGARTHEVTHAADGSLIFRVVKHDDDNAISDWSYVSSAEHRDVVRYFGLVAKPQRGRDRG